MTNIAQIGGTPPPPNPNTFSMTTTPASDLPIGSPLTSKIVNGNDRAVIAAARSSGLTNPVGFASTAGRRGKPVRVQYAGPLTLTPEQWALVVTNSDATHELLESQQYYLSATDGQITTDVTTTPGEYVVPIGRAISATTLMINIGPAVLVS